MESKIFLLFLAVGFAIAFAFNRFQLAKQLANSQESGQS
jgi:hypothetical protein